jgi:alkanesulfonate monooxygenase SsuD/methylene tetrahydromethanopterin reductase-like flavin-dependent oxidoreductase (luciferase family)
MPDCPDEIDEWMTTIRDPANQAREGWRTVNAGKGKARAVHEIAPLPGGRFAVRIRVEYLCGNVASLGIPWRDFDTREECLAHFLEVARGHFAGEPVARAQREATERMRQVLRGPFREPRPEPVVDEGASERERAEAARKKARAAEADRFPLFREQIEAE